MKKKHTTIGFAVAVLFGEFVFVFVLFGEIAMFGEIVFVLFGLFTFPLTKNKNIRILF